MSGIIYRITNIVNSKFYIGKTTKTIQERFKRHCYNHKDQNTYLYKSMRKHGIDKFIVDIIEETDFDSLNEREIHWIKTLQPHYNMTSGGEGGDTSSSPNFKLYVSRRDVSGSNNPMYGRSRSDTAKYLLEAKDKMIQANRCPVVCDGIEYPSVGHAQEAYTGINIRKRLDNPKYPNFYRLRERTRRN